MIPRIPYIDSNPTDFMELKPKTVDIEHNVAPQEAHEISWSSAFEPKEEEEDDEELHEPNWTATVVIGAVFILFGFFVIFVSVGIGIGVVFLGVLVTVGGFTGKKAEENAEIEQMQVAEHERMEAEREWEEAARARQQARQQEIEEIVKAVKTTIRIRCRYCGTLNEESANKCEACGGSL